jgi:cytochrome c oxidase subunit I+III
VIAVAAMMWACMLFSYGYLWALAPQWPPDGQRLPDWIWPAGAAAAWAAGSALMHGGSRGLARGGHRAFRAALVAATIAILGALALDLEGHRRAGLAPAGHGYGATVAATLLVQGLFGATLVIMAAYCLARSYRGLLGAVRRATFDNTLLLWHYTTAQAATGLAALHLLPRWLG